MAGLSGHGYRLSFRTIRRIRQSGRGRLKQPPKRAGEQQDQRERPLYRVNAAALPGANSGFAPTLPLGHEILTAITHIAPVKNIALWQEGSKYVLNFAEPAKQIGPIKLVPKPNGTVKAPQAPRYTSYKQLTKAANLDEAF